MGLAQRGRMELVMLKGNPASASRSIGGCRHGAAEGPSVPKTDIVEEDDRGTLGAPSWRCYGLGEVRSLILYRLSQSGPQTAPPA